MTIPLNALCPCCGGTGTSVWRQPSGLAVPVRCGLCRGHGKVDSKTADAFSSRPLERTSDGD
jgi:DnaJ-class molecular chaperone